MADILSSDAMGIDDISFDGGDTLTLDDASLEGFDAPMDSPGKENSADPAHVHTHAGLKRPFSYAASPTTAATASASTSFHIPHGRSSPHLDQSFHLSPSSLTHATFGAADADADADGDGDSDDDAFDIAPLDRPLQKEDIDMLASARSVTPHAGGPPSTPLSKNSHRHNILAQTPLAKTPVKSPISTVKKHQHKETQLQQRNSPVAQAPSAAARARLAAVKSSISRRPAPKPAPTATPAPAELSHASTAATPKAPTLRSETPKPRRTLALAKLTHSATPSTPKHAPEPVAASPIATPKAAKAPKVAKPTPSIATVAPTAAPPAPSAPPTTITSTLPSPAMFSIPVPTTTTKTPAPPPPATTAPAKPPRPALPAKPPSLRSRPTSSDRGSSTAPTPAASMSVSVPGPGGKLVEHAPRVHEPHGTKRRAEDDAEVDVESGHVHVHVQESACAGSVAGVVSDEAKAAAAGEDGAGKSGPRVKKQKRESVGPVGESVPAPAPALTSAPTPAVSSDVSGPSVPEMGTSGGTGIAQPTPATIGSPAVAAMAVALSPSSSTTPPLSLAPSPFAAPPAAPAPFAMNPFFPFPSATTTTTSTSAAAAPAAPTPLPAFFTLPASAPPTLAEFDPLASIDLLMAFGSPVKRPVSSTSTPAAGGGVGGERMGMGMGMSLMDASPGRSLAVGSGVGNGPSPHVYPQLQQGQAQMRTPMQMEGSLLDILDAPTSPRSVPKYTERDVEKMRAEWETEKRQLKEQAETAQQEKEKAEQEVQKMAIVMNEWEETMEGVIADNQLQTQRHTLQLTQARTETTRMNEQVAAMEKVVGGLRQQLVEEEGGRKRDEEQAKKRQAALQEELDTWKNKYDALKKHAEGKLEGANVELARLRAGYEKETMLLKARLQQKEVQVRAAEAEAEKRAGENKVSFREAEK
ncbi:hypothetical protein M427DRAFT_397375 [Gonapodya prolifera JEL478]|uniref:Transforming acidic coiled-coil-containing protein C-terminal domain-containing protein n=1 Tax=Gonapodya prolifera (strain JEL478) TaxID=1344416 RepID=A0A139A7N0_GONPJ|nr:hypothetical protein M427DRAFT_397375 [Gonapodya prolifera JEL478]|eukprot:KXS12445.1 hypothetical protein M427DRAFT_397375 [Gonapodya prolifera JEL478]